MPSSFESESIRKRFTNLFLDRRRHQTVAEIEDDWEFIEKIDEEFSDSEGEFAGDGLYSNFPDPADHIFAPGRKVPTPINFKILMKADVLQRLEDKIVVIRDILPLSRAEATILLHHFKWSVDWIQDEWLGCEEKTRNAVGLYERPVVGILDAAEIACGNCCQNYPRHMMFAVSCGHQFCCYCWTAYISQAISHGPKCLAMRCLNQSCDAAVGRDMVELLSPEEDNKMFEEYLLQSSLSSCKEVKWCPGPACEYAVFSSGNGDINNSTVTCQCLYKFCWNCANEAHSPVDCNAVAKWMTEISAQSENWVLANTKPCPSCKLRVEEEPGLKFLLCYNCNHEFCCECGCSLSDHDNSCQISESSRHDGFQQSDHHEIAIVKKKLERYNHYYDGWAINESSRANAVAELILLENEYLEMLGSTLGFPVHRLGFVVEAQVQIVECWQVLKWTCVYGYFLNEDELTKAQLLEFMQGQAEDLVKILQQQIQEMIALLLNGDVPLTSFIDFRRHLVSLTQVIRNHFNKMESALKEGLSEVYCVPTNLKHLNLKKFSEESFLPMANPETKVEAHPETNAEPEEIACGMQWKRYLDPS